jgi:hypothetical protein
MFLDDYSFEKNGKKAQSCWTAVRIRDELKFKQEGKGRRNNVREMESNRFGKISKTKFASWVSRRI